MIKNSTTNQLIQQNLRGKGLTKITFNKVFEPPTKLNSLLLISHLHKKQPKNRTKKSTILRGRSTIYVIPLFFFCWGMSLQRTMVDFLATQLRENKEATVTQLTTICGRHHGQSVVLAGVKFLLFSCSTCVTSHGHLWGSKYTQMRVKYWVRMIQIPAKNRKEPHPRLNREFEYK